MILLAILLDYDLDIGSGGNDLQAYIIGRKTDPQAKALSEGQAAASGFINQAGDLIADAGVSNARKASSAASGPAAFTALSYGNVRYETGSHVDVQGFSILVGAAYGFDTGVGGITVGGFLEYGTGDYGSYNDFADYASVNGEGDTVYFGGGLLGRLDVGHATGSTYFELSARAGRISVDFASFILGPVSYDASSAYYGIHAGVGRVFNLSDAADLDLYGKFFWTRQEGKSVSVPDPVTFGDIDSARVRVGARLTHRIMGAIGIFAGAAYEHEFGGKATAVSNGIALETPALRGDVGIGELGLTAIANENVSLDFGLQGYAGGRRGVGGSVKLNIKF